MIAGGPGPLERTCPVCEWAQRDCRCAVSPAEPAWSGLQYLFDRLRSRPPTPWEFAEYGYLVASAISIEYPSTRVPEVSR